MKSLFFVIVIALATAASASENKPQCADATVRAAVQKNYKQYKASTNSCGIKPLVIGEFLETYLVCVSDETEPTEYIAVIDPREGKCNVKFIGAANEASTPHFDTDSIQVRDLTDALQCSQDPSDGILVCKKPVKGPTQEEINAKDACYKDVRKKLFSDALASNLSWGFEELHVISKTFATTYVDEAPWDEASETEKANAKKLIDANYTLTYLLDWTAPSNKGSSVVIVDKDSCKEITSVVVISEE